jgi:hypothetical protein
MELLSKQSTPSPGRARRHDASSSVAPVAVATNATLRPSLALTDPTQSTGLHSEMSS